jgi:hypothetical protein
MSLPSDNEIRTEYDDDSQSYFVIWQPLVAIGAGRTEQAALEDLRAAAHFGIETTVNSKLNTISPDLSTKRGKHGNARI